MLLAVKTLNSNPLAQPSALAPSLAFHKEALNDAQEDSSIGKHAQHSKGYLGNDQSFFLMLGD